jgi:hypothetical protein
MDKTTTLDGPTQIGPKPRPEVIEHILNFSRAYQNIALINGERFEMIKN